MSEDDTLCLMAKDDANQEVTSQTSCSSSYESIPTSENLFDQFKKMMVDFEEINLKHSSLTEENKLLSEENLKLTVGRKSQLDEITQLKTENESLSEKVKSLNKELGTLKSKEAVDKLLETTKHKGREGLGFDPSSSKRRGRTTFIPPKPTAKPNKQKGKEKEKPTEVPKKVGQRCRGAYIAVPEVSGNPTVAQQRCLTSNITVGRLNAKPWFSAIQARQRCWFHQHRCWAGLARPMEISKSVEKTLEIISLLSKTVSNTMEIYTSDSQLQFNEFNKVKEQIANVIVGLQKQMSLLQMDIRSALAIASANQVVTKDYLKVIIDNQKEAYKLFRLIGAHIGNRKMEVILQQHNSSPIPQLPIAVNEGEASYIPSSLKMTNLILEAQQRNLENSAQHLSSSGLDGTKFIGAVTDHFSDATQSEERRENLKRIKELCGNMQGISEVAGSSKRKRN
ncbi:unnamed protein product [Cuscuta campestris]|uniref:Uncharacterized protein n=1 Tax=Cuscuta campestris TaxID=132261 RepID=A0A484M9L3_9ASTE|nr:unnamed protein product [Cuscuta campestris]